ncbi:MAG: ABC transporter ATP-binding protein [Opitutaceae bacterium]|jgi:ABC-2 type transport system ATP-binding protein
MDSALPPLLSTIESSLACETRGLQKRFGAQIAVDGLDLRVPRGLLYGFLGPNGAGKTTSLRMITGLLKPDRGEVYLHGHALQTEPAAAKTSLAYIPDEPVLYGKLNAFEYLEFVAALWAVPASTAQTRAWDLLTQLGLLDRALDRLDGFSRGMKQKMVLAGALIHEPWLLLLDEPLTGLDAASARLVKDLLLDYVARGRTVILTTHILEVAERLAQRIGILHHGRLLVEGTLEELRERSDKPGATLEEIFLHVAGPAAVAKAAS